MTKKQKRIAELIKAAPHMTAEDVAKTLRVKRRFVYKVAKDFGLKYRSMMLQPPTPRERRRIVQLAEAGMSDAEIADRLELRRHTVERIRIESGLRQRGAPVSARVGRDVHIKIARMHLVNGLQYGTICAALGVTRGCVAGAVYRARKQNWDLSEGVEKEVEEV